MIEARRHTAIKICGIRRPIDAETAVFHGAQALGFVLWSGSPRSISVQAAAEIVRALPPLVTPVGVFVNPSADEVEHAVFDAGIRVAQIHGSVPQWRAGGPAVPILRAVHLAADGGAALEPSVPEHAPVLLDAPDPVRHGGTGRTVDWTRARVVASTRTVVLAGGLTHRNVARAIREVRPYGVDVASGVESEPGVKVAGLLEAFARQVHAAWADRDTEERS